MAIQRRGGLPAQPKKLLLPPGIAKKLAGIRNVKSTFTMEGSELGEVVTQVREAYGNEVCEVLSKRTRDQPRIRTGVFVLDLALAGGWLTSRGSMLYGERSAGKSTIAGMTAVRAQQQFPDMAVAWIDVEGTFDHTWFLKMGGDPSRLVLIEPESGEHAVDVADAMCRSKEVSLMVTDSIAMLVPMKEIDSSAEDSLVGVHARLVGNYLRRVNSAMLKERHRGHRVLVLHINQFRMKIGVMFGDPRTLPGGKALEFATSQQVEIKNKEILYEKGPKEGQVKHNEHSFKITKDKTGGKLRTGKFLMVRDSEEYGGLPEGTIHQAGSILALGADVGLVNGKEIIGFGKEAGKDAWMKRFLDDPEMYVTVMDNIIDKYIERWGLKPVV